MSSGRWSALCVCVCVCVLWNGQLGCILGATDRASWTHKWADFWDFFVVGCSMVNAFLVNGLDTFVRGSVIKRPGPRLPKVPQVWEEGCYAVASRFM